VVQAINATVRDEWNMTSETRLPPPGEPRTLYPECQPVTRELYLWGRNLEGIIRTRAA
jgi:hypothetical protein